MSADLSVIMPVFNCENWVEEAVRSVVENADGLLELIVVDDGSTDRSAEIVESIAGPITLIRQANAGPSAARNAGMRAASGAIIGFLDADDIWTAGSPDERRVAIENGADVAFARVQVLMGNPPKPFSDPTHAVSIPSIFVTRAVIEQVGELDESIVHGEDVDWVMRMKEAGLKAVHVDQVAFNYRMRPGSLTRDREVNRPAIVHRLKDSLERRGKIGSQEA
jgi:glycosyltransferase involved in cell wall biosynthesis